MLDLTRIKTEYDALQQLAPESRTGAEIVALADYELVLAGKATTQTVKRITNRWAYRDRARPRRGRMALFMQVIKNPANDNLTMTDVRAAAKQYLPEYF